MFYFIAGQSHLFMDVSLQRDLLIFNGAYHISELPQFTIISMCTTLYIISIRLGVITIQLCIIYQTKHKKPKIII